MRFKIADLRVVFLITGSAHEPYLSLRRSGQEKTWIKCISKYPLVDYRYLISNGSKSVKCSAREDLDRLGTTKHSFEQSMLAEEHIDELIFDASFGWESILSNFVGGLEWAITAVPGFDFLIRTNVSSYWNLDATLQLRERLPRSELYAGNVVKALDTEFVAGDGIIFSRDVISTICQKTHLIDAGIIDDVAIGRLMNEIQIPFTHIPRRWVRTRFDVNHPDLQNGNMHHFRCKFERVFMGKTWRRDVTLMRALHSKFKPR